MNVNNKLSCIQVGFKSQNYTNPENTSKSYISEKEILAAIRSNKFEPNGVNDDGETLF